MELTSGSEAGNIWSKTETSASDPDPNSDRIVDPKLDHRVLLAEEREVGEEDPKISSNPTRFPQTPADIFPT